MEMRVCVKDFRDPEQSIKKSLSYHKSTACVCVRVLQTHTEKGNISSGFWSKDDRNKRVFAPSPSQNVAAHLLSAGLKGQYVVCVFQAHSGIL